MNLSEQVIAKLHTVFPEGDKIELVDEKHDGRHYLIKIISNVFEGKSRIERSRMIYDLLGEFMKDDHIHALRMELKTLKEV